MDDNYFNRITPGFCSVLGMIFIVLKICHLINWSWFWVLSPFWIPIFAVGLAVCIIFFIVR